MMFSYHVPHRHDQTARDQAFYRMQHEGLLGCAMPSIDAPTIDDWRRITNPATTHMVHCMSGGDLYGVGILTPLRHRTAEIDITAFRASAPFAVDMMRQGIAWVFAWAPCDSIVGICPVTNRHVWQLAEAAGFGIMGRIPGACYLARRKAYVDGVFVCAKRTDFTI